MSTNRNSFFAHGDKLYRTEDASGEWVHVSAIAALESKLSTAEARIGRLREAMTLAECQYLGCGGSLTDSEALANTRRVLQEALRNDTPPQAEGASDAQP